MAKTGTVTVLISFNGMYAGDVSEDIEIDATVEGWARAGLVRIGGTSGGKTQSRPRSARKNDSGGSKASAPEPGPAGAEPGQDPGTSENGPTEG